MKLRLVILFILGLLPLNSQGCPMSEPINVQKISQILLKPVALVLSDDTAELSDDYVATLTETLSLQTQAAAEETKEAISLEYVRPMSGGVHVLRLEPPLELDHVKQLTEQLSNREDVEYAEVDQPRRR